ncbi:putative trehalase [Smittium mucronatum]|uniref:Trehalase n=1 Tax=Smittium mucronatum TaxID=133383 RepID=A0A1R0GZP1_9FUNG|nr:putative trehalase [Smittium mucronatum]
MGDSEDRLKAFAPHSEYYRTDYRKVSFTGSSGSTINSPAQESFLTKQRVRSNSLSTSHNSDQIVMIDVEQIEKELLLNEDTDGDFQITILDSGPKFIRVPTLRSQGFRKIEIKGTYMVSNLLQEIGLAKSLGRKCVLIDLDRLNESPVTRIIRMIRTVFWEGLTRRMDEDGIEKICKDPKNRDPSSLSSNIMRLYVPDDDVPAYNYYSEMSKRRPELLLQVHKLPNFITPEYVRSINREFGILSLAANTSPRSLLSASTTIIPSCEVCTNDTSTIKNSLFELENFSLTGNYYDPIPFVVPGGRFNEMYGWDSYFIVLGLLEDRRFEMCKGMVTHFVYQINHYGKILNANRSYYLTRSQPPFLTDMILRTFEHIQKTPENLAWLKKSFEAAIKEYKTVWVSSPRLDPNTGLSCYHPTGIGMPPETEASHYDHVIERFSKKLGISIEEYIQQYNSGDIKEPELDNYFIHDRAVRESGHDTTYRLDKKCAHLATVDLNSLLYKYEIDIGNTLKKYFSSPNFQIIDPVTNKPEIPNEWFNRSEIRKAAISKYLYNYEKKLFFDYNVVTKSQELYESVTCLYTLWSGCASSEQAEELIPMAIRKFCHVGGLTCGTESSRGNISIDRPNRQWDYPFGWAPHQIVAWKGLEDYGYSNIASMLAYRWLYAILKSYIDFNGVVPEKLDVVNITHIFDVEYGNVGTDFKLVSSEGFGWMNSSIEIGLKLLNDDLKRSLASLIHPNKISFD